jgi:hypothetical protein
MNLPERNRIDMLGGHACIERGRAERTSMTGIAESVTGLSVSLIEQTIGLVARAVVRVDELNVGLSRRNALQAVTANRAWRTEWEES